MAGRLFNGKCPSYLDSQGKPHLISTLSLEMLNPLLNNCSKWFANPKNGVGALAGQGGISWIDLNRKNFDSQTGFATMPGLKFWRNAIAPIYESTRSGGCHIAVKLAEPKTFTNFEKSAARTCGEFLGEGRFVVLSPTPGYVSQNGDDIASAESVESLGLAKVGSAKAAAADIPDALTRRAAGCIRGF